MGWIRIETAIKKAKNSLREELVRIQKQIPKDDLDNHFYFDDKISVYKVPHSAQLVCKVSILFDPSKLKSNCDIRKLKNGKEIKINVDKSFIKFKTTGGKNGNGKLSIVGDTIKSPSNNQQELAIMYCMKQSTMPSINEVNKEIGFDFDAHWYETFKKVRAIRNKKYFKNTSLLIHDATDTVFAKPLFKLCKSAGYKDSKDNWNPADMWLINGTKTTIMEKLKSVVKNENSIHAFNDKMKELFEADELIGISLKEIALETARFHIIDPSNRKVMDNHKITRIRHTVGNKSFFIETNTGYEIKAGYRGSKNSGKIYFEGHMKGSKVQLGAISIIILNQMFKDILGIDFDKTQNPPTDLEDFDTWREFHIQETIEFFKQAAEKDKGFIKETYFTSMKQTKYASIYLKLH